MTDSEANVTLLSFPTSPYGVKVGCYLAYKKINYQFIGVSPITFKQVAFTNKRQVPVLQIADQWKLESTDIGVWLDEVFPELPLLPESRSEKAKILELDNWVTDRLIVSMFRLVVDWPSIRVGMQNGWTLSRAVNQATPLPRWVRFMWPVFVRKAKFIVAMMDELDRSQSLEDYQQDILNEFVERLQGGPFLGGQAQISLADLSGYSVITFPYRLGLQGDTDWMGNPAVSAWVAAVDAHLPDNPFLVGSDLLNVG